MELQVGDIIACKDNSLISKCIKWITKSQYSHLAIVYDILDCGEVIVGEINMNYTFCIREMKYEDYDVFRYKYKINTHKVNHEIIKLGGYKYDFLDILKILFGLPRGYSAKRLICSEAIDEIYKNVGCDLCVDVNSPTPQEVIESVLLAKL